MKVKKTIARLIKQRENVFFPVLFGAKVKLAPLAPVKNSAVMNTHFILRVKTIKSNLTLLVKLSMLFT